jgi:carbon-monoxide dehydrogenase medium subunit/xanthine dehydrogenase FAD-binding subunit
VTHTAISSSPLIAESLPALARASSLVGSRQIRNRGTVGGNIANASPCADTVPALLLYDAEVVLMSAAGTRRVPLSQFVLGPYKTALGPGEILHSIACKKDSGRVGWSYIKLGRRQAVNISRMTLAVTLESGSGNKIMSARISAGSVFPASSRMPRVEKMLIGEAPSRELYHRAAETAAELMIEESGPRWSTPYKKPVLIALLTRALEEAGIKAGAGRVEA